MLSKNALFVIAAACIFGAVHSNQAAADQSASFRWMVGDAIQYSGSSGSFVMQYLGIISGHPTFRRISSGGSVTQETRDSFGNAVMRIMPNETVQFTPNNGAYPSEQPRVGLRWKSNYVVKSSVATMEQYRTKTCVISSSRQYRLSGLPLELTAYQVNCENQRAQRNLPADESYEYVMLGGIPIMTQYSSFEWAKKMEINGFVGAPGWRNRISQAPR
jgi:hypothetical protein